jgi:hypothetical protein
MWTKIAAVPVHICQNRLMERPHRSLAVDEKTSLAEFLEYLRATMLWKVEGLDSSQAAAQSVPTTTLTLSGIVKHLAFAEDYWFQDVFLGAGRPEPWASAPFHDDPDWEFHSAVGDDLADVLGLYQAACERSRQVLAQTPLDGFSVGLRDGEPFSMRWIMLHMIEETARHAGHADLLREAIDGETGE